jgi:hypothetical protein
MPEPNRLEAACRGDGWVESARLQCLGFDCSVRANDTTLVRYVTSLYEACLAPGTPRHRFILRRRTTRGPASVTVYRDGRAVLRHAAPDLAVAHLVWEINRGVVEAAGNRLLLHAAAAERDGTVVLLPGSEGAGKSTLVAALVCAGLRYVTDETVAIDASTGAIEPYPKPIALDRGSLTALSDLGPDVAMRLDTGPETWLVPPGSIRADAVAARGGVARLLVLPAYRPDSVTSAQPISRAEAAVALAELAFNFRAFGSGALGLVADVVRGCGCYRLAVGDLDDACRVVLDLLEPAAASR